MKTKPGDTALVKVPDMTKQDEASLTLAAKVDRLAVTDQVTYQKAADLRTTMKGLLKEIESTFGPPKKQLNEAVKALRAAEAKHSEPLETALRVLDDKMVAYVQETQRREREAAEKERKAQIAAAKAEGATKAEVREIRQAPLAPIEKPKAAGVGTVERWGDFDVVDLGLVPRQWLVLDVVAVRKHYVAHRDDPAFAIPGLKPKVTIGMSSR